MDCAPLLPSSSQLHIRLLFDDKLKRHLTSELKEGDLPEQLAKDLVINGLVNEVGGAGCGLDMHMWAGQEVGWTCTCDVTVT